MASLMNRLSGTPVIDPSQSQIDPGGPAAKVPVHGAYTRVIDTEPGDEFPSIPDREAQAKVKQWIECDEKWINQTMADEPARRKAAVSSLADKLLVANDWLGHPASPERPAFHLRVERQRLEGMRMGKRRTRLPLRPNKKEVLASAARQEVLVPIRIDAEYEGWKLRDSFTWNINDKSVPPDVFARYLVEDMRLPEAPFVREVASQIKKQLQDAQIASEYTEHLVDDSSQSSDFEWWQARKRRKLDLPLTESDLDIPVPVDHDMRLMIKLDITQDDVQLVDRFEWDISSPRNSAEDFAAAFAADLGLSGEFQTAIAHSIREQVEVYVRSLCVSGWERGQQIADPEIRGEVLPTVSSSFRTDVDLPPLLLKLTWEEIERNDKEREREVRRKRRQTKGRGPALPDREFARTHRTPVPMPGPPVTVVIDASGQSVFPQPEVARPYPIERPDMSAVLATWNESNPLSLKPRKDLVGGVNGSIPNSPPFAAFEKKKPEIVYPTPHEVGLHEVYINGIWHCANCGVPDGIAIGRRKGLTGPNTLCGECGKHYQRTKKNRICEYSLDPEFHRNRQAAAKPTKKAKRAATNDNARKAKPATVRAVEPTAVEVEAEAEAEAGDQDEGDSDQDNDNASDSSSLSSPAPSRRHLTVVHSPNSDTGDTTQDPESRLSSPDSQTMPELNVTPLIASAPLPSFEPQNQRSVDLVEPPAPPPVPPAWMQTAADEMRAAHTDDRFEIIPRPRPPDPHNQEWRIRCLDCPGKLYNVGPGESFTNFETHFKNRQHRQNVEARLRNQSSPQVHNSVQLPALPLPNETS